MRNVDFQSFYLGRHKNILQVQIQWQELQQVKDDLKRKDVGLPRYIFVFSLELYLL